MFPENLVTEDIWGALPILYVVWGNAQSDIVDFLVERYESLYPGYRMNWTNMAETLIKANKSSKCTRGGDSKVA